MQQLSGLDATFLFLETPEMPMHVGALHLFELPNDGKGNKGKWVTRLREHMASRLPVAPALRRRLWWMPLNLANPAWVDAEPDLKQHIVEIKLPKGAGLRELEDQVAQLHPVLLDRSRPLWKFHVFEGLAPGPNGEKRVALYTQLHHAAVDGQAAVALANAILDVTPEPRVIEHKPSARPKTFKLEMTEMLRGVLGLQAQKVASIVKNLPDTVGTLKDTAVQLIGSSELLSSADGKGGKGGKGSKSGGNLSLAPRTPMNVSVGRGRSFATVTLPLSELKLLGRAHGATINDMVLAVCSGALRRYLARHRLLPKKSLVAAVPISLRQQGDTTSDNQASMSLISLGTHVADTAKRLAHIQAASAAMKSTMGPLKKVLPTDFPSLGVPWLMEAAVALYGKARVADRIPQVANVVISNVPGPPVGLFMAGAKMVTNYPASIVVHGMALNITVQSYDRSLDFGLIADASAMPDLREVAEAIRIAFDDLRLLPLPGEPGHADTADAASIARAATKVATQAAADVAGKAGRTVGGLIGSVAKKAVSGAVSGAMSGAVTGAVGGMVGGIVGRARKAAAQVAVPKVTKPAAKAARKPRSVPAKKAVKRG